MTEPWKLKQLFLNLYMHLCFTPPVGVIYLISFRSIVLPVWITRGTWDLNKEVARARQGCAKTHNNWWNEMKQGKYTKLFVWSTKMYRAHCLVFCNSVTNVTIQKFLFNLEFSQCLVIFTELGLFDKHQHSSFRAHRCWKDCDYCKQNRFDQNSKHRVKTFNSTHVTM